MELLKEKVKNNYFSYLLIILILWFSALIIISAVITEFDHDELEAVHTAWKISTGEKIYIDFFQHHHPLFYWLIVPFLKFFGETTNTLIALRILMLSMVLGISSLVYHLAKRVFDEKIGLLSVFFIISTYFFYSKAIEIRPDVPQILFGLLAILFLFNYLAARKKKYLVFSSVMLAISFLFLQKAIFLIILLGIIFLVGLIKNKLNWRDSALYILTFSLMISPFYLYAIYAYSFQEYFFLNWILNANSPNHFPPFEQIFNTLKQSSFLWLFFFLSFRYLKTWEQKMFFLLAGGLVLSIILARSPFPQYFVPALPLVAIISAWTSHLLLNNKKWAFSTILIINTVISSYFFLDNIDSDNKKQLKKINYVLNNTNKNDYVYDGDALFNVYRQDIDYFWYSLRPRKGMIEAYQKFHPYHYDVYESIEKYQPQFISKSFIDTKDPRISEHYRKTEKFDDLFMRID